MKTRLFTVVSVLCVLFVSPCISYACPPPPNEEPVAILTADPEYVLKNEDVTLDGSDSYDPDGSGGVNGIYRFEWVFGDGSSEYETSGHNDGYFDGITTHPYTNTGTYTVELTVYDDQDATDTDTCMVYVGIKIYVPDGQPSKTTIQAAVNEAHSPGGTVIVKPGTYYNDSNNRDIDFKGKAITVRSTDPDNPDVVAATVIDCDGNMGLDGPRRAFLFHNGEDGNSVINGFTIREGYVVGWHEGYYRGGGIYCDAGTSPTIKNCVIAETEGRAIQCEGTGASPTIANCIFVNNEYTQHGTIGAISGASPVITDSVFTGNMAEYGGAIHCSRSSVDVTNCIFNGNRAFDRGGAIYCNTEASAQIRDSIFVDNYVYGPQHAGLGGAISFSGSDASTVVNCLFVRNQASIDQYGCGGGIYSYGTELSLINCVFTLNYAGYDGGGIYNDGSRSDMEVTNCVLRDNLAGNDGNEIYNCPGATLSVTYSHIKGGWDGDGNIDVDPQIDDTHWPAGLDGLFGTADDGLRLGTDSPCIDEGTNSAVTGIATDIIGNTRIADGNHSGTATVDMGAYELPKIWFVDGDAEPDGEGKSWEDAFDTLQEALALDIADCNEIWVAAATNPYKPGTECTDSFLLVQDVPVYGGFAGSETTRSERNWAANQTILSGDLNNNGRDPCDAYHVVTGVDGGLLDGFTIKLGNANGSGLDGYGGGIYCYQKSPTIRNCLVEDNYSGAGGAGLYCSDSDSLVLANCVFSDNTTAGTGAAAFNHYCSPEFTNCVFVANTATGRGGGVYNSNYADPNIINCTFFDNSAAGGGGGMCNVIYSSPTVTNCIFFSDTGGEIQNRVSAYPSFSHCDIEDCNGSGQEWDGAIGTDGGGNIDSDPCFADVSNPPGSDGRFWTGDDGLRLDVNSLCIDAGYGDTARSTDILGWSDVNIIDTDNAGAGYPDHVDMGAYELYDPGNDCACGPAGICAPVTDDVWNGLNSKFPDMVRCNVCREAPVNYNYNCIAWTIDVTDRFVWDEVDEFFGNNDGMWTVSDFDNMYSQLGKSAILYGFPGYFAFDPPGHLYDGPQHAAKILPNNCASSKDGNWIRYKHDRNEVEGGEWFGDILRIFAQELVKCFSFKCSKSWSVGDYWSIDTSGDGKAVFNGLADDESTLGQPVDVQTGKSYTVRIDIDSFVYQGDDEGELNISLGGTLVHGFVDSGSFSGIYTYENIQPSAGNLLQIEAKCLADQGEAYLDIDINYISVREEIEP